MPIDDLIERMRNNPKAIGCADRAEVHRLALHSPREALKVARKIEHPWYRCQAITTIVENHPKRPDALELLEEALSAAYSQSEPNRIASVSYWPLHVLAKISPALAEEHTQKLLQIISEEPHSLRRLDGLRGILKGAWEIKHLREHILERFIETANVCPGWRGDRLVSHIARDLLPLDYPKALQMLKSRPENRFSKKIFKQLSLVVPEAPNIN